MGKFIDKVIDKTVEILVWATLPIWGPWVLIFKLFAPDKNTVKIAILGGSKGCGKTELWNQLRGTKNPGKPTTQAIIESFVLGKKQNGDEVTVETSKDYGGGKLYVEYYKEIINSSGVFIYFLIDLRTIKENTEVIRARLRKIGTIIKKNKYENCGICIVGTFYDKYKSASKDKEDARNEIWTVLKNIKELDKLKKDELHTHIINTTNKSDIEEILREIFKTLN